MKDLNWKTIGGGVLIYTIGGIVYTIAAYATVKTIEKISAFRQNRKWEKNLKNAGEEA